MLRGPTLIDAARRLLGVPPGSRMHSKRREERAQRHADALAVIAMWPPKRGVKGIARSDLAVARAEMIARGDDPSEVARQVAAFAEFMAMAADEMLADPSWAELPARAAPRIGNPEEAARRRDALRAALGQKPWRDTGTDGPTD